MQGRIHRTYKFQGAEPNIVPELGRGQISCSASFTNEMQDNNINASQSNQEISLTTFAAIGGKLGEKGSRPNEEAFKNKSTVL